MSLKSELWRCPLCDLPGVSQGSLILMLAMHDILIIKNEHQVQQSASSDHNLGLVRLVSKMFHDKFIGF